MDIGESAQVSVLVADVSHVEASSNKANLLGAFTSIFGGQKITTPVPVAGAVMTPPFGVFVSCAVPPSFIGTTYALSVDLRNEAGDLVDMPGGASSDKLRIAQVVQVLAVTVPGIAIREKTVWPRQNMSLNFPGGLPLLPDQNYSWVVEIDGTKRGEFQMYVASGAPMVVLG
jgi:hypothetical protein